MAWNDEFGAEPPISQDADGHLIYRPMLSVDEGYGMPVFGIEAADLVAPPEIEVVLIDPEDFDQDVEVTDEDRAAAVPIDEAVAMLRSHFDAEPAWEGEGEGSATPPAAGG